MNHRPERHHAASSCAQPISAQSVSAPDSPSTTEYRYLIGDIAALTGLTPHALRAWERVGLLAPRRSQGGVRH
ncbi:MAG TPA: MerR family DNA-binding transcriptional regulator, partial [Ktedonobacterales bacterium]